MTDEQRQRHNNIVFRLDMLERGDFVNLAEFRADVLAVLLENAQLRDDAPVAPAEPNRQLVRLFCNAIDNLNDMPISDEWAERWAKEADDLLIATNHFRAAPVAPVEPKAAMLEIALRAVRQHLERDEYTEAGDVVEQAIAMADQVGVPVAQQEPDTGTYSCPQCGAKSRLLPIPCARCGHRAGLFTAEAQ